MVPDDRLAGAAVLGDRFDGAGSRDPGAAARRSHGIAKLNQFCGQR